MTRFRIRFGPGSKKEEIAQKIAAGVSQIGVAGKSRSGRLAGAVSRHLQRNKAEDISDETPRTLLHQRIQFLRSLIVRILFCLDDVGLDRVKEEFLCQPHQELTIVQFVSLMVRVTCESGSHLLQSGVDASDIAQALAELFDTMDLNGNHTIEFAEFLETCIHWGLSSGGGIESRQILDDPIAPFSSGPHSRINSRATKKHLIYLPVLDQVLVFEPIARKLLIMDPDYLKVTRTVAIGEKKATAVEYIHGSSQGIARRLTAVSFLRCIILYEGLLAGRFLEHSRIPLRVKILSLRWMQHADLLLGGGSNGSLFAWDLDGRLVQVIKGHSGSITSMVVVPGSHQVLTGSTDRSIRLRDLQFVGRTEKFIYLGHSGAITCLAVNNSATEFISGSISGELFVWSLIDSHVLHKISGHARTIVFASFISDSPEFITADESGHYRVWDSRLAFSNVEIIQVGCMGFNHCGATICTKRDSRILIPSDFDVFSWDQRTQRKDRRRKREIPYHTEENLIFCEYLDPSCMFVTATSRTIRFWNALTGCLKEQYDNIMGETDIAAMCFDASSRKMIVGDHRGRIHIFNAMSGGFMKKFVPHDDEVLSLKYVVTQTDRLVISLSKDGRLRSHDEAPILHCPVRLDVRLELLGIHDPSVLATSSVLAMAAVGDQFGRVSVWNLTRNRISDTIRCTGSITGLEFIGNYPMIAVANGTPDIALYALEPDIQHGNCVLIVNGLAADILTAVFVNDNRLLYVADAAGFISGFDLNPLIDQDQIHPVVKSSQNRSPGTDHQSASSRILSMKQLIDRAQTHAAHGIPRITRFQAGLSSITAIGLIADPASLFVLSFSPHLTIWSLNGNHLGTLGTLDICRRSKQRSEWRFQIDTRKRLIRSNAVARQVVQSLVGQQQTQTRFADLTDLDQNQDQNGGNVFARTFLTQKIVSDSTKSTMSRNSPESCFKRKTDFLKASIFHDDRDTLTLEERQQIRKLKQDIGVNKGLFSQDWRSTPLSSPFSTKTSTNLNVSRSEINLLSPIRSRRRVLGTSISKPTLTEL